MNYIIILIAQVLNVSNVSLTKQYLYIIRLLNTLRSPQLTDRILRHPAPRFWFVPQCGWILIVK